MFGVEANNAWYGFGGGTVGLGSATGEEGKDRGWRVDWKNVWKGGALVTGLGRENWEF